jgi:excinuclease ABC subunit A
METIENADNIVEAGPEPRIHGGYVVAQGTPEEVTAVKESVTGEYLKKVL